MNGFTSAVSRRCWTVCALLSLALVTGCESSPGRPAYRKARLTQFGKEAGFTAEQQHWIDENCPEGRPKKTADDLGNTRVIAREGYVLEHSAAEKIPLWVCEHVTQSAVSGTLGRGNDPFAPDPLLAGTRRAELADYKGSGYDRGHQAPSGDQTVSQTLQDETYYLSNMAPQWAALNQRIWKTLEERTRKFVKSHGDVWVITGPMFYDPAEDDPATADGYIPYYTIGEGVAVPTHCYKIVIWKDSTGAWQGTGFVIENHKATFKTPYDFNSYTKPIAWIEEQTGLNFMPNLSTPDRKRVEETRHDAPWDSN